MTEKEFEKKMLLNKKEFQYLQQTLYNNTCKLTEQINYYYDTPGERLRNRNITCRIRQKENELLGTLKQHYVNGKSDCSLEKHFAVKDLPKYFTVDTEQVILLGTLYTARLIIPIDASVTLMLDRNIYLGTVDYELEMEFAPGNEAKAEAILTILRRLLSRSEKQPLPLPKSERFFRRLHRN